MRNFKKLFRYIDRLERRELRREFRNMRKQCRCTFNRKGKSMCWGLIFGVLLVIWGITQIFETLFHVSIPIFGVILGVFLLYLGFTLITGGFKRKYYWHCGSEKFSHCSRSSCSTTMGTSSIKVDDESFENQDEPLEYKTVFAKSSIDLRSMTVEKLKSMKSPLVVNIDTVFGKTEVKLNKDVPVRIFIKGAFGNSVLPDSSSIVFGSHTYNSHGGDSPLMLIYISTVFGSTEVERE